MIHPIDYYYIYKVLSVRPLSYIELISEDKVKERIAWRYEKTDVDSRVRTILSTLDNWKYIHCPEPPDAHKPYAGFDSKPRGHWKYFIKRKGLTLKKIEKLLANL